MKSLLWWQGRGAEIGKRLLRSNLERESPINWLYGVSERCRLPSLRPFDPYCADPAFNHVVLLKGDGPPFQSRSRCSGACCDTSSQMAARLSSPCRLFFVCPLSNAAMNFFWPSASQSKCHFRHLSAVGFPGYLGTPPLVFVSLLHCVNSDGATKPSPSFDLHLRLWS